MSAPFDAYHQWLGIPPVEQPPNHYRLLGINQFESEIDVIDNAADRQMAHLRTFQSGQYSALSQKLLNEIAAARICLLDHQKQAEYDEQLRGQTEAGGIRGETRLDPAAVMSGSLVLPPVPMSRPSSFPPAISSLEPPPKIPPPLPGKQSFAPATASATAETAAADTDDTPYIATRRSHRHRSAAPVAALIFCGVAFAGLLGLALFLIVKSDKQGNKAVAIITNDSKEKNINSRSKSLGSDDVKQEKPKSQEASADDEKKETATKNDDDNGSQASTDNDKTTDNKKTDGDEDKTKTNDDKDPLNLPAYRPESSSTPSSSPPAPTTVASSTKVDPPTTVTPDPPAKLAAPSSEQRKKMATRLDSTYRSALASARSPRDRRDVFDKLLIESDRYPDDPSTRYGLLEKAYNIALVNGDFGQAEMAFGKIIDNFDVDAIRERTAFLDKAKVQAIKSKTRIYPQLVGKAALDLALQANEARRFSDAEKLAELAAKLAARAGNKSIRQQAIAARDEAKNKVSTWNAVRGLLEELEKDPNHPTANYVYGRYLVVLEGDFQKGLPMLAKAEKNKEAQDAALMDLKNPTLPSEQLAVGEAWYQLAKKETKWPYHYYARAWAWYSKASPALRGDEKIRAENGLDDIRTKRLSDVVLNRAAID